MLCVSFASLLVQLVDATVHHIPSVPLDQVHDGPRYVQVAVQVGL
jgi:hypothetical protein